MALPARSRSVAGAVAVAVVATTASAVAVPAQAEVFATASSQTPATSAATPGETPEPPGKDPFYRPPEGYESTAPGTVLRSREVTVAAAASIPLEIKAWQLLYRSTDAKGEPMATVTTAMLPANARPGEQRPLLSYQVAQNSVAPQCAPSYQLRQSFNWDNIVPQIEMVLIAAAVRQGWAVTVPDHLGPMGAYTAGKVSGHAALDAVRATENFEKMGLDGRNTPVGMWGYSGGAHASGWAAELQRSYAPELDVKGVATGGIPPDLEAVYQTVNRGPFAGIALTAISGLSQAYPELARFIQENTTAEGKEAFAKAESRCVTSNLMDSLFSDIDKYMTVEDPLKQPVPAGVLDENRMDGRAKTPPMFVYHSVGDQLIPSETVDELVRQRCAAGNQVTYQRDIVSEHLTLTATGAPDALDWLKQRLDGEPAPQECSTETVSSSLADPKAMLMFGKVLLDTLIDLLGRPVGPPANVGGW